jgi:hypothetical protein
MHDRRRLMTAGFTTLFGGGVLLSSCLGARGTGVPVSDDSVRPSDKTGRLVIGGADSVVVDGMAALEREINAAPPGRQILIAPGTYAGDERYFGSAGTVANPIVIGPRDGTGTVTIDNPRWNLAARSSHLVILGLDFERARISMRGSHNRITGCRFRRINRNTVTFKESRDGRVDHCDFSDYLSIKDAKACIYFDTEGFHDQTNVRNLIDYCYFHDIATSAGIDNQEIIRMYGQRRNVNLNLDVCTVDHCLFKGIDIFGEGEVISVKSGGWTIRFCTFENVDHYLSFRQANNGEVRSCWFEKMKHACLNVFGDNHLIIGNRFVGDLSVRIAAGNAIMDDVISGASERASYARSYRCQIVGNVFDSGHLMVGAYWGKGGQTVPAASNNFWDNMRAAGGDAHMVDPSWGTVSTFNDPNLSFVPAVKLTAADVGLNAPGLLSD